MKIIVYTKPHCRLCYQVTNVLLEQGLPFLCVPGETERDPKFVAQLDQQDGEFPVVKVDGAFIETKEAYKLGACQDGRCGL